MKKFLKILGITVLVIFVLLLVLPFLFKGKIIEIVKEEANKNLKAKVEFEDVSLSLIRNFPNLAVGIEELSVSGVDQFEGDTLAAMDELFLVVDIMSVIRGEQIEVKKIILDQPDVHVIVLKDGTANYDIAIEGEEVAEDTTETGGAMDLSIEEYRIDGGHVIYDDASADMKFVLKNLDHTGTGNFAEEIFTLSTETHVEELSVIFEEIAYLNKVQADLNADIAMDLNAMKFTFEENQLDLNNLSLGFDGWLAMPEEDIDMDLSFSLKKSDLRALLSLVPATYTEDLDNVDAAGQVALAGYVKGTYNDNSMPGFGVDLTVEDGRVQYPDLPKSIENIQIAAHVENPEGADMNRMKVNVPRFHMEIGKTSGEPNTVDATLQLRNPMTDPHINTKVVADLNFGSFKDVIPMEDEFSIAGNLNADFHLNGALSSVENQQFNEFEAGGTASLDDFAYADADVNVKIPEARLAFTPQQLDVETVKLIYEEINMQLDGYVSNYIAYALKDTTLRGEFNFNADRIDLNAFMAGDEGEETEEEPADTAAAMEVVEVPDNLNVTLNATIGEVIYDKVSLNNVKGKISIDNAVASLDNLAFQTLGGSVNMNGSYDTRNIEKPTVDFAFDIDEVEISETFKAFVTIQKMAPIAKYASGNISSQFDMETELDQTMTPVYETMNGRGTVSSDNIVIEGGEFLQKLSNTLKAPELARQEIKDLHATFIIEEGKVITEPFDVELGRIDATISGYTTFDETIDYTMALKVPTDALGSEFNQMAKGLLSQANSFLGSDMSLGEFIKMDVKITGDLYDPTITPAFAGMEGSVKEQATEAVKEAVEEEIDKAKEQASEKAKEILEEAQKQADQIIAEAEKAAQKLRDEADKQAQKLIDEANNPLAKAGAKIAADKIRDAADTNADKLIAEARKQAENILNEAKEEADKIDE